MLTALVVLVVALAAVVVYFVLTARRTPPPPRDTLLSERLRERFIVTVEGGRTFDGLLCSVDDRTVILIDCSAISKDERPFPVDGEVVLRRDSIAYMQKP